MDIRSQLPQAVQAHQSGNLAEAEKLYQAVRKAYPMDFAANHFLGLLRSQQGRIGEAIDLIALALKSDPNSSRAWSNYGLVLLQGGRMAEALKAFDKALALEPSLAGALYNRGNVLIALGRFEEALADYGKSLALMPGNPEFLCGQGTALSNLKRYDEALASFDQALAIDPRSLSAHINRGNALRVLGRRDEALASFDKAAALDPRDHQAPYNRGATLQEMERHEAAITAYDASLALAPHYPEALYNRGGAQLSLERYDDALKSYDAALAARPDYAEAVNNRGVALWRLGRLDDAIAAYDKAIALRADYAEAFNNRGTVLRDARRFDEALASLDRVLAIEPKNYQAWNMRAAILRDLVRVSDAVDSLNIALSINPDYADALFNRGNIHWTDNHRYDLAIADLERALRIDPDKDYARGDLLHARMHVADWRNFEGEMALIDSQVRAGKNVIRPFEYQAYNESPADLQRCAASFTAHLFAPTRSVTLPKSPHDRIRIGYVAGEFREHATAYLTAGLYEMHDREKFEVIAFDNGESDNSPMRARLEAAFDRIVPIARLSDRAAAEAVAAQGIDILVNMNGYFGAQRAGVFAMRPAPVQVNFIGFPGTMAAPYMDYIIADRVVIPDEERQYYTEQVVRMPGSYQVNDSARAVAAAGAQRREFGLPEQGFVFCNFNQSYKLTPEMFASWMRILSKVDGSVLWLMEHTALYAENLRKHAMQHGVAPERLIFAPHIALSRHLSRLSLGDLFLDSVPCNAHTTASDALWAGVPLITVRGKSFAGRVAASLLEALYLPELATAGLEEYEALAIRLAQDPAALKMLRQKLEQGRATAPLFDTARYTKQLESAFSRMWQGRGEAPRGFEVPE